MYALRMQNAKRKQKNLLAISVMRLPEEAFYQGQRLGLVAVTGHIQITRQATCQANI